MEQLIPYQLYAPPVPLYYPALSKEQARQYFAWFLQNISLRLQQLQQALDHNTEYPFALDFTLPSLAAIGRWFQEWIEIRSLTEEERAEEEARLPSWFHENIENWTLTEQTFSLCFDIGIYFGEIMRHHHACLNWELVLKPRTSLDIHQPVLAPFPDKVPLNAVRVIIVIALKAVDGLDVSEELLRTYRVWEKSLLDL